MNTEAQTAPKRAVSAPSPAYAGFYPETNTPMKTETHQWQLREEKGKLGTALVIRCNGERIADWGYIRGGKSAGIQIANDKTRAKAHLIAAAPALVEALKEVTQALKDIIGGAENNQPYTREALEGFAPLVADGESALALAERGVL